MFKRSSVVFLLAVVAGCGVNPGVTADPVDISGKVTAGGKPVDGIVLNLLVTGTGTPAAIPIKEGAFQAKLTPGKYTYYITKGTATDMSAIPEKYGEGSMDRQIEIAAGQSLNINLE